MSFDYLIDIKVSGDDLKYMDTLLRYLSSSQSTRGAMLKYMNLIQKELFQNEYYIINFYIEFMGSIKNLSRLDLSSMKRLIALDKEQFADNPHMSKDFGISVNNDRAGVIEQLVVEKINELESLPEPSEEDFELSISMMKEIIKDMKVQNLIFVSSEIFYQGKKIKSKLYKGRDDYLKFMQEGLLNLTQLEDENPVLVKVTKEYLFNSHSSNDPLFKNPLPTLQSSWGDVCEGDCYSILAGQNVGKTTVVLNYVAESLIAKKDTALFISEMNDTKVTARLISIIGARKYGIRIPTSVIEKYFSIGKRHAHGGKMSKSDSVFLANNEQYINNIEYIYNALQSESNSELGTFLLKPSLVLENMHTEFEMMQRAGVKLFVVDHINGVISKRGLNDVERINRSYQFLNSLGKKHGIATVITNHIPEKQRENILVKGGDQSGVRGSRGSESVNSPDYVILLDASMEQRTRGEFVVSTNKDRNSNTFFENFLGRIHVDVGMVYEVEIE